MKLNTTYETLPKVGDTVEVDGVAQVLTRAMWLDRELRRRFPGAPITKVDTIQLKPNMQIIPWPEALGEPSNSDDFYMKAASYTMDLSEPYWALVKDRYAPEMRSTGPATATASATSNASSNCRNLSLRRDHVVGTATR